MNRSNKWLFLGVLFLANSMGYAEIPSPYDTQKEEIPLPSTGEIVSKWKIPEGFNIQLFASDPMVRQPIHITTDERGRLWVCENYTYAESGVRFAKDLRDRILILEDVDGDGVADNRKVFWEGGQKLTSVEVGSGGVWALCAPQLLFIPDKNKDDIPDSEPIVILDGWEDDAVGHNIVNGLKWGPDGWLYGRHGI
ncbi:MAG: cytochrome C, partial [Candidatus Omnitrophica bacterium]|nr:cytochrome C [Candidatus Omnitrophota bacterium]